MTTNTQERQELVQDIIRWAVAYSKHEHLDHEPFASRVEKAITAHETALRLEIEGELLALYYAKYAHMTREVRPTDQYRTDVGKIIARIFDAKIKP